MNKRILLSLGMIVVTGAVVVGGTGAFFSDTESSTGNVFTAGSVSLKLDSLTHEYYGDTNAIEDDYFTVRRASGEAPSFRFNDLKPGDTGMIEKTLTNGANDAFLCARNTLAAGNAEFTELLTLRANVGAGMSAQTFYNAPFDEWYTLDASILPNFDGPGLAVAADQTITVDLEYCLGSFVNGVAGVQGSAGSSCVVDTALDWNALQNQEIEVDVDYYAVQQRNNSGFTCGSLNDPVVAQPLVGANFALYEAPLASACTVTLVAGASVNAAIDSANAGEVICLGDGAYAGPVDVDKAVTIASVSGPAATTINGGIKITSSDVVVKGLTVQAGIVSAEPNPVGFYVASGNNIEISSNSVDGTGTSNGTGILTVSGATYNNVLVENNIFANLTRGMYTNPGSGLIEVHYNDFLASNAVGIGQFSGANAWRNEFSAAEALGVDGAYDASPGTVEENNFLNGADINVYVTLTTNVDAPNNFFNLGGANQTNSPTSGQVDFTPEALAQFGHR